MIFIHFIFYFHNVDLIELLYGSSNDAPHNNMTALANNKNIEHARNIDVSNTNHNESQNEEPAFQENHSDSKSEEKLNRENHIKELLQGLEELQET